MSAMGEDRTLSDTSEALVGLEQALLETADLATTQDRTALSSMDSRRSEQTHKQWWAGKAFRDA